MRTLHHVKVCFITLVVMAGVAFGTSPTMAQKKKEQEQPYSVAMKLVLKLLAQADVQKELELDDDQIRKINTLANKYPHEVQAALMKIQALPITRKEQSREALQELQEAHKEKTLEIDVDYAKKLEEILLPFQRERIGQVGIQLLHARPVFVSVFKSRAVAEQAELTEKEARALSRVTSQAEIEYLRELRELKLKYHQQVRDSFSPEVHAAVQEILGAPYITVPEIKKGK